MHGLIKDGLGTSLNEEVPRKSNRITEVRVRSVLNIFFPKNISQVTSLLDWRLKGVNLAIEVILIFVWVFLLYYQQWILLQPTHSPGQ